MNAVRGGVCRFGGGVHTAAADTSASAMQEMLKSARSGSELVWKTENAGSFTM